MQHQVGEHQDIVAVNCNQQLLSSGPFIRLRWVAAVLVVLVVVRPARPLRFEVASMKVIYRFCVPIQEYHCIILDLCQHIPTTLSEYYFPSVTS